jgi:uncharacterized protein (TIGR02117 family)
MKILKIILKYLFKIVLGFVVFVVIFIVAGFILPYLTVNNSFTETKNGVEIFVQSNGTHSDVVVPVKQGEMDWRIDFPRSDFKNVDSTFTYLSIGFGNREFYLNTPTWNDLKVSTALKAASGIGTSALHVYYFKNKPKEGKKVKSIFISETQYKKLTAYIKASLAHTTKRSDCIYNASYGENDSFYHCTKTYCMFHTCNNWTGNALKHCGVKVGIWTPFDTGLLNSLPD